MPILQARLYCMSRYKHTTTDKSYNNVIWFLPLANISRVFPVHRWPDSRGVQWQWRISVWACFQVSEMTIKQYKLPHGWWQCFVEDPGHIFKTVNCKVFLRTCSSSDDQLITETDRELFIIFRFVAADVYPMARFLWGSSRACSGLVPHLEPILSVLTDKEPALNQEWTAYVWGLQRGYNDQTHPTTESTPLLKSKKSEMQTFMWRSSSSVSRRQTVSSCCYSAEQRRVQTYTVTWCRGSLTSPSRGNRPTLNWHQHQSSTSTMFQFVEKVNQICRTGDPRTRGQNCNPAQLQCRILTR